jgi:hypothetical protein
LLAVVFVVQALTGNRAGAIAAAEGFVLSLAPLVIQRWSGLRVPRVAALTYVLVVALQYVSESLKLYELFYYYDKFAHPAEVFLSAFGFALLLLGYLDTRSVALPRPFAAAVAMLFGIALGASWEFVEFTSDWFGNADLQKSNADTMTDIFANDVGAILGTLFAFWLYHHLVSERDRAALGALAARLNGGLGKLLDRRGAVVFGVVALVLAGAVLAFWFVDRNPPRLPVGLPAGQPATWTFTSLTSAVPGSTFRPDGSVLPGAAPGDPAGTAGTAAFAPLSGNWQLDKRQGRGVCRVNVEHPRPGSEKPGLLALAPGTVYGADGQGFAVTTRLFEARPPDYYGSQMTAGIAVGVVDKDNFYLVETSALHDLVRLSHYLHGRRRDIYERRVRTRGSEAHELQVRVEGGRVTALLDGSPVLAAADVPDTAGGVGLWARVTDTACFAEARIGPLA